MTGKELVLVLGVAAALGSGAAATHALMQPGQEATVTAAVDTSDLDGRMESLEKTQARTAKALERLGDKLDRLSDNVVRTQMESAKLRETVNAQGTAQGSLQAPSFGGVVRHDGQAEQGARLQFGTTDQQLEKHLGELKGMDLLPEGMGQELEKALDGMTIDFGAGTQPISGMLKGMRLRQLPEEERWKKAQEDLGLSYSQVEDLKAATTDLDTAMDAAMVTEERDFGNGQKFTLKRTDPEKTGAARKAYQDRVDNTLDTDQREKWKSGGYGNAFGRSGGGNAIAVTSINTLSLGQTEATQTKQSNEDGE